MAILHVESKTILGRTVNLKELVSILMQLEHIRKFHNGLKVVLSIGNISPKSFFLS